MQSVLPSTAQRMNGNGRAVVASMVNDRCVLRCAAVRECIDSVLNVSSTAERHTGVYRACGLQVALSRLDRNNWITLLASICVDSFLHMAAFEWASLVDSDHTWLHTSGYRPGLRHCSPSRWACMRCRRASIDVCECMLCFSLTPSDAASSVARRCCSLLRAQVGRSLAVDGCPGRQLCQCMPYCCCRRLVVGVKRNCDRSLGVDYATYMYYKSLGNTDGLASAVRGTI